jgi:hypothetical protein
MGLPIKFEMQSHMNDVSTSGFNSSLIQHKDLLNNNNNKPMPMLDPCKNVHVEIQQLVYQDQLFHRE